MFSNPVNFIFYSCSKRCFKYQKSFTKSNLSCDNPKKMFALKTYALIIANFFFLVSLWHNTSDYFSVANSGLTKKNRCCKLVTFIPNIVISRAWSSMDFFGFKFGCLIGIWVWVFLGFKISKIFEFEFFRLKKIGSKLIELLSLRIKRKFWPKFGQNASFFWQNFL